MPLETIRRLTLPEADRMDVQERVIKAVEADPERFLKAYREIPESHGGRYVCADLMKETFPEFNASREHRGRYNAVVHNAAAVLTAEQYRRVVNDRADPTRDRALFITGMPGAGKTSTVRAASMVEHGLSPDVRVVYEGQMVDAGPAIAKVSAALDAGAKAQVLAVLPHPEQATEFTFRRFEAEGRGAGRLVMARIQEGTPDGLEALLEHFRGKITIAVNDVRDRAQPRLYEGSDGIKVWREELKNGPVLDRINAEAERRERDGRGSVDALRQFRGQSLYDDTLGVRGPGRRDVQENVSGRGIPPAGRRAEPGAEPLKPTPGANPTPTRAGTDGDREAARVFRDREMPSIDAVKAYPKLADSYRLLASLEARATADGLAGPSRDAVVEVQRERIARQVEEGRYPQETSRDTPVSKTPRQDIER